MPDTRTVIVSDRTLDQLASGRCVHFIGLVLVPSRPLRQASQPQPEQLSLPLDPPPPQQQMGG